MTIIGTSISFRYKPLIDPINKELSWVPRNTNNYVCVIFTAQECTSTGLENISIPMYVAENLKCELCVVNIIFSVSKMCYVYNFKTEYQHFVSSISLLSLELDGAVWKCPLFRKLDVSKYSSMCIERVWKLNGLFRR